MSSIPFLLGDSWKLMAMPMQEVFPIAVTVIVSLFALLPGCCGSDLDMLLEFKRGVQQDSSGLLFSSWNRASSLGTCPPNWYGVQCSGNRVSSIILNGVGLSGTVSWSALAKLEMLRNLSLSGNKFTGIIIPEQLSFPFPSLQILDLSCNSFTGPVPDGIAKSHNLNYLNLSFNNFQGPLPPGIEKLRNLKYLDLHANAFTGSLDSMPGLGQLPGLVLIDLSRNRFTGSMKSISDKSPITGSLEYLNLSHNLLSGELFTNRLVPLFDNLVVFDASYNQLSGIVPSFNFIVSLQILLLKGNRFSGFLPEALFAESSMVLTQLDLSCNQLEGPLKSIGSAALKNLNLSSNKLSGSLPAKVGSCAIIDLSHNRLSGSLSTIQSWGNYVEVVDLSSNLLTGTFLNQTIQLPRLLSLKASNNLLTGELPPVIGLLKELSVLDLNCNRLYGHLTPTLFTSTRLTDLNLSGNGFTGPIPFPTSSSLSPDSSPSPFQNISLITLDLSNNSFSGTLAPEIGTMVRLKLFDIHMNNISGGIPGELGNLHNLLYLDLSFNSFEGGIPSDLPDGLLEFNVSYNNLSGIVPGKLMRFNDTAFHPGNGLLIFLSNARLSHAARSRHQMKVAILYALIFGSVACLALILVLLLMCHKIPNSRGTAQNTGQFKYRIPNFLGLHKGAETNPTSNFSHDLLLSSRPASVPAEHVAIAAESVDTDIHAPKMKGSSSYINDGIPGDHKKTKFPIALIMSSSLPSVTEHPSIVLKSPDKLHGDLHLFDNETVCSLEELSHAPAEIIGRSCHGTSYMATIGNRHVFTIKWLKEGFVKSKKEFSREAKKLGNIKHQNLVPLRGYYCGPKQHEKLVISDYIDAVSLMARVCDFESQNLQHLSLIQRLNIAVDIARCLDYLHNEKAIPHGNLKSTNILVESPSMSALLTDYSLHRLMTPEGMAEQVANSGALGYCPPEFSSTSKPCPSLKSDVYAFGVILLELLTGKNAGEIISADTGVVDLTDWVKLLASDNRSSECFDRLILHNESAEGSSKIMVQMLGVALRCIRSASERPEIRTVFEELSALSS